MKRASLVAVLLCTAVRAWGQLPDIAIAPPPPATQTARPTLRFPISEAADDRNMLLVPVTIAGKEHLFLLDTGATCTLIDTELAKALGDAVGPEIEGATLAGQDEPVPIMLHVGPMMSAGGERLRHTPPFVALMRMKGIQESLGKPVEGMLGMDVLKNYVLHADFKRHFVELLDPEGFAPPAGVAPVELGRTDALIPTLVVDLGKPGRVQMMLDTGRDVVMTATPAIARALAGEGAATAPSRTAEFLGDRDGEQVWVEQPWSFQGVSYQQLWVTVRERSALGMAALSDFDFTLDFQRNRGYFQPLRDKHPADKKHGSILFSFDDGRVVVAQVLGHGATLGIQVGDELVALNGKPLEKDLRALSDQMKNVKGAKATFRRGDTRFDVEIPNTSAE